MREGRTQNVRVHESTRVGANKEQGIRDEGIGERSIRRIKGIRRIKDIRRI